MTQRKLIDEDDILEVDDGDKGPNQFYIVKRVEDIIYDQRAYASAVATGVQSDFVNITNLEPKFLGDFPGMRMYQIFAGVDVGMVYVELEAGEIRRTPYKVRKPGSSNRYVGHFDSIMSPYHMPTFEFFVRYNERPAFSTYNNYNFNITPNLAFRGRKILMFNLADPKTESYYDLGSTDFNSNEAGNENYQGGERRRQLWTKARRNEIPHRHITMRGIER